MMAPKRTAEEIEMRVQNTKALAAETHMKKTAASNQNFQNTRVTSTKAVLMKNGELVCVAFPNPNKNQPSKIQQNRSSETTSFSS